VKGPWEPTHVTHFCVFHAGLQLSIDKGQEAAFEDCEIGRGQAWHAASHGS
jgi:hypothetical protein